MEIHVGDEIEHINRKTEVPLRCKTIKNVPEPINLWCNWPLKHQSLRPLLLFSVVVEIVLSRTHHFKRLQRYFRLAGNAFGALKKSIFSSRCISESKKSSSFQFIVYGAEPSFWQNLFSASFVTSTLCERLLHKSYTCIRAPHQHRATPYQIVFESNWALRVQTSTISWLVHTARMPFKRLPRKLLSSWCFIGDRGAPKSLYGRGIKAFEWFGIDRKLWHEIVFDRDRWRELFNVWMFILFYICLRVVVSL